MSGTDLRFNSFDGLELQGTLDGPDAPRAMALLVHGITADREEWGFFTRLAEHLTAWGIRSLRFDYRCHGAARGIPMDQLTLAGIENDIDAASAALRAQPHSSSVPEPPLILVAVSFGGGVAARWSSGRTDVELVVLCSPVLDYVADLTSAAPDWRVQLDEQERIDYAGNALGRGLANEVRAFRDAEIVRAAPPTVIFHGTADADVPISRSRRVVEAVPTVRLVEVDGADHGFVVPGDLDAEDPQTLENYDRVFAELKQVLSGTVGVSLS